MLANLSVINVLTESHRSGRGNRSARHRLAPPAMLTDDSWATGKKKGKKTLPTHVSSSLLITVVVFSTFLLLVHLIYAVIVIWCLFLCCWDYCYDFWTPPPRPHSSLIVFRFLLSVFGWILKNCCASHFVLLSCEFSLTLCIWLCMCVCVCLTVQCCSWCVVVVWHCGIFLSDCQTHALSLSLPSFLLSVTLLCHLLPPAPTAGGAG